jgi:peptide/nickel transport system permease protein
LFRFLSRRLLSALAVLLLASIVIFALIRLTPGDPAATLAGPNASPHVLETIRSELGLDESPVSQYLNWIGSVVTFDLGRSYVIGGEVGSLITTGLGNTALLAGAALFLASLLAFTASIAAVVLRRRWFDSIMAVANTSALAVPTFVTGPLVILVLAVLFPILPAGGLPPGGVAAEPVATLEFLILPAVCLALPAAAGLTRFLTEGLHSQMEQPYVMTARALGIPRRRIVLRQALPNVLPSAITVLGIQCGYLLGGTVLIEAIFAWPGLGQLAGQAITDRDYPLVQALLLLSVTVFVVIQLITDVLHAYLDPRVRVDGASA